MDNWVLIKPNFDERVFRLLLHHIFSSYFARLMFLLFSFSFSAGVLVYAEIDYMIV